MRIPGTESVVYFRCFSLPPAGTGAKIAISVSVYICREYVSLSAGTPDKRLSYCRGAARAVSVEMLSTAALYKKNPFQTAWSARECPWRSLTVIQIAAIRQAIYYFLSVVCSNNVSTILYSFRYDEIIRLIDNVHAKSVEIWRGAPNSPTDLSG